MTAKSISSDMSEASQAARRLFEIEEVDTNRRPKWFLKAIKKAIKAGELAEPESQLEDEHDAMTHIRKCVGGDDPKWLDHVGTLKVSGVEVLVSEPFAGYLNLKAMQELNRLVELIGSKFEVSPNSWYYPGETFRITIWPKE